MSWSGIPSGSRLNWARGVGRAGSGTIRRGYGGWEEFSTDLSPGDGRGLWALAVDEMEEDKGEECKDAEDQNQHAKDEPGNLPAGAIGGLGDAKGVDESRCKCFKQTHVLRIRRLREWDGTG
jgi:hypothetical protein